LSQMPALLAVKERWAETAASLAEVTPAE
ncbi:MAG: hypothetical protein JWP29_4004, partial [Rhodoferax sp.]|nr:hypothetical protein [Rhodoferax sp.]